MKWEYKTIKLSVRNFYGEEFELKDVDKFVNQFGQMGWELISTREIINPNLVIGANATEFILFFKRPLADNL